MKSNSSVSPSLAAQAADVIQLLESEKPNPDSGIVNPDSGIVNPDSGIVNPAPAMSKVDAILAAISEAAEQRKAAAAQCELLLDALKSEVKPQLDDLANQFAIVHANAVKLLSDATSESNKAVNIQNQALELCGKFGIAVPEFAKPAAPKPLAPEADGSASKPESNGTLKLSPDFITRSQSDVPDGLGTVGFSSWHNALWHGERHSYITKPDGTRIGATCVLPNGETHWFIGGKAKSRCSTTRNVAHATGMAGSQLPAA